MPYDASELSPAARKLLEADTGTNVHDELAKHRQAKVIDDFELIPASDVGDLLVSAVNLEREQAAVAWEAQALHRSIDDLVESAPLLNEGELLESYQRVNAVSSDKGFQMLQAAMFSEPELVQELLVNRELQAFEQEQAAEAEAARAQGQANFDEAVSRMSRAADVVKQPFESVLDFAFAGAEHGIEMSPEEAAIGTRNMAVVNRGHEMRMKLLEGGPAFTTTFDRERIAAEREAIANEDSVAKTTFRVHRSAAQHKSDVEALFLGATPASEELGKLQLSPALAAARERSYRRRHGL